MSRQEALSVLRTPRDVLRYAISRFQEADLFFGHGTSNALDEAAYLILHGLHLPHDNLDPFLDARLLPSEIAALLDLLENRITRRIPAAYLTHEAWLGEFKFYVDERVIVPRSFIAELLREQMQPWISDPDAVHTALDLCTGSGCLAIVMAHAFPHAHIDALDISPDALAVARKNVSDYALQERIRLAQSDLFSAVPDQRYDIIICNPPYVTAAAMQALPREYQQEPSLALASGEDGLGHIRRILDEAYHHLHPAGYLVLELGHNRAALEQAYPQLEFTWPELSAGTDCVALIQREHLQSLADTPS